ncbi:MAG: YggS family pyridoxal phosphate-dependent enzyme [Pseudomonadota bacterium]|nr:YggS family pyridoxal phosphate-dependent enzyme [Pseudomonadota bacterium]HJO35857.1 YggS family pyridoxal phosphate-dependent enzyme [Gammaproteobacteria bacterium]
MKPSPVPAGTIAARLAAVRERIAACALKVGRDPAEIELLAVSKGQPAAAVRQAHAAGQRTFGESYLQEALAKQAALAAAGAAPIDWHFIGPLQRNKCREVARSFDWVHSVDRWVLAERLDRLRPPDAPPLNVCLQVNISGEASKRGAPPEAAIALARRIAGLERLRLRGLMAIPAPAAGAAGYAALAALQAELREALADEAPVDTLSAGMSGDLEAAITAGSTLVRVGTALFGPRPAG